MKNITLSLVAIAAVSTFAIAGGDIAPVEPAEEVVVVEEMGNFYLGLAYTVMGDSYTRTPVGTDPKNFDDTVSDIMFQAGYQFNDYIAVEGRYWANVSDLDVVNQAGQGYSLAGADAWGLYVKPMYPVTDTFDVYALLGYGGFSHNSEKLNGGNGFSWGVGASYSVTESVDLFIDYTSIYNDSRDFKNNGVAVTKDLDIDTINFGVSYNF